MDCLADSNGVVIEYCTPYWIASFVRLSQQTFQLSLPYKGGDCLTRDHRMPHSTIPL